MNTTEASKILKAEAAKFVDADGYVIDDSYFDDEGQCPEYIAALPSVAKLRRKRATAWWCFEAAWVDHISFAGDDELAQALLTMAADANEKLAQRVAAASEGKPQAWQDEWQGKLDSRRARLAQWQQDYADGGC